MPAFLIGAAIAGVVSGTITAGVLAFSWAAFATAAVLGGITTAMAKKPQSKDQGSLAFDAGTRTVSVRQPIAARRVVVGECRVGGVVTFMQTTESHIANDMFHSVITLTGHEILAIDEVWFDDTLVDLVYDSGSDPARYAGTSALYSNYAWVTKALGTTTQSAPPQLVTAGQWTTAHKQTGCAYVYTEMFRVHGRFANGMPNVSVTLRGYNGVRDPRGSPATTGWSNNPALIVAAYLTNADWGLGVDYATGIDEPALITAANICDERVSVVYTPAFTVTAIGSPSDDSITFTAEQTQILTGDAVRYKSTGADATPLVNGSIYYLVVLTTTTAQLASSRANALADPPVIINITAAGSGTLTLERCVVFTANAGTDVLTYETEDKRIFTGDKVRFECVLGDTLPAPLAGIDSGPVGSPTPTYYYFVIKVSASSCKLAATYADALAGNAINISSAGTGTFGMILYDAPRYTCNGTWLTSEAPRDVLPRLLSSMAGIAVKVGGKWRIQAGAYITPTETLTESELRGPVRILPMRAKRDNCNGVRGVIAGPESNWQPTDFKGISDATYVSEDDGEELWRDIELPFTNRANMAQRLAKIELNRTRQGLTFVAPCRLSAFRVQPGDTVQFTFARYGWTAKVFDVVDGQFAIDAEGKLAYDLTLRETDSTVYDWEAREHFWRAAMRLISLTNAVTYRKTDALNTTPAASINVGAYGAYAKGLQVLALVEFATYPQVSGKLTMTFTTQETWPAAFEGVAYRFLVIPYYSKPTASGTIAIAFDSLIGSPDVALYAVTGTSTDFTQLAAGDYIYSDAARPLFSVVSITDATHMKVQLEPTSSQSSAAFPVSGWSFTAYRPGTPVVPTPYHTYVDAAVAFTVKDFTFSTAATLDEVGPVGVLVVLVGGTQTGYSVSAVGATIAAQWVEST